MQRRFILTAGLAYAALPAVATEVWPSKPVKVIVPFPAGGTSDQMARLAADELSRALRQPFIVENRSGAAGNVGMASAAQASPDGYTLVLSGVGTNAINPGLYDKLTFDTNRDFVHITQLIAGPNVLVVHPSFPAKSFKELIAYVRERPGKLSYASSGSGSSGHLAMELLKQQSSADLVHVPYRGGAPALNDVLGNQVPMMFLNQDVVLQHIKAGKLRALAVSSAQRNALYPEVPTVAESGFPGFDATSWVGISAPRGTPTAIADLVHKELAKALAAPAVKNRLESAGFVVVTSRPSAYQNYVKAESERWAKVIKTAGIRPD
ncbi:hypothetical protein P608_18665 [Comamonas thiooxydans]|uniref:Tripartite tricarboxylate transporter substrate binding protein n=1 Tax=Comamonas thiooxydans TaxID=363952 RepID=A0A0E3BRJ8_9BURK|nr:tripartite tricarboxylate transporter substrate binding protein [Comamonas thiooxydans]KGH08244.1 hypothetical protein P608_18665 [Comamonas thiooxydans]KGH12753.1 hypothetical protein P607_24370 [Comamonas thiooxydans]